MRPAFITWMPSQRGTDESVHGAAVPSVSPPWEPPVIATVAARAEGVDELVAALDRHFAHLEASGELGRRRARRLEVRTREVVERSLRRWLRGDGRGELEAALKDVAAGMKTPYNAAAEILARLRGSVRV